MRFGGIILCGGKSTRMGVPKAMLPFGPELMLQRVVRLLGEVVQPLVVVAAPQQELPKLPGEVIVARDEREGRGPLEGLLAGLSTIEPHADAAYATSCDVPLLVPAFAQRMIDSLEEYDVAVPAEDKFHHPLAAVYRTRVLPTVKSLLAADRMRPAFLFDEANTCRVPIETLRDIDPDLRTLANLNHAQDYFEAAALAGVEIPANVREQLRHTKPD